MSILSALFYEFFKTGLFAIGGGLATLPFLYDIARRYDWMPIEMMPDMIAVSESTPGPIGINMATYAGYNSAGIAGAVVATFALVLPSLIIVLCLAKFLAKFNENPVIKSAFSGLHPAVTGLIAAAGWQVVSISLFTLQRFQSSGNIVDFVSIQALVLFAIIFFCCAGLADIHCSILLALPLLACYSSYKAITGRIVMEIIVMDTPAQVYTLASQHLLQSLVHKPTAAFSFAGGNTTEGFHYELVRMATALGLSFANAHAFGLDEYLGISSNCPSSVSWRLRNQAIDPLGFSKSNIHLLDSMSIDPSAHCTTFDSILEQVGLDFQVLGMGDNGHLAFNEPGTPFGSRCHLANLTPNTIVNKADRFGGASQVPLQGITVGISSIMQAHKIVMLVKGSRKASIVYDAIVGSVCEEVPASVLQLHPNAVCILDRDAASLL